MELEFIKKGNNYEAIFEVPSDFNIHIELNKPSYLGVYQNSIQNGEYSFATEYKLDNIQKVYDIDFGALVYPKWIKVVSGSEVVSASVNFNEGGGSGSGSGSGGDKMIYYEVTDGTAVDSPDYQTVESVAASVKLLIEGVGYIFGKLWRSDASGDNEIPYLKAFAFAPIDVDVEADNQKVYTNFPDFETVCQNMGIPFGKIVKRRITAEEYWAELNAE